MAKNDKTQRLLFAAFYVGEAKFNATEAAALAGYEAKNRNTLQSIASELMRQPEVKEFIAKHVQQADITQDEILREMTALARWSWQDHVEQAAMSMNDAKVFDTMMRGKVKALADLQKLYNSDLVKMLDGIKKAFEEHRKQFPDVTDAERAAMFTDQGLDPKMVDQVMRDLLEADENKKRLAESEAETEDPMIAREK